MGSKLGAAMSFVAASLWGCSVGCSKCTGNGTRMPNLDHCPEERSAGYDPLKAEGALNPRYRTVNLNSTPGSVNDIWKYNPWRA